MRNASLLRIICWIHLLQQCCAAAAHGGAVGEQCTKDSDCQDSDLIHCKENVCSCKHGKNGLATLQCKEAVVTPDPIPEVRECYTDHQCYRGYCWDGTCHCKDGFSKERNSYGGWSCVHRTSSFGFGILAVIPVTVVVICLVACCVQVALRRQQQVPVSNAAAHQDLSRTNSNATISGVSNIYRQRRYFPHYVESSAKPHTTPQSIVSSPCVSRPIEMKTIEAKETVPEYDEAASSNSDKKPWLGDKTN